MYYPFFGNLHLKNVGALFGDYLFTYLFRFWFYSIFLVLRWYWYFFVWGLFIDLFLYLFIYSFIYPSNHSFIHSFTSLGFIHDFVYGFLGKYLLFRERAISKKSGCFWPLSRYKKVIMLVTPCWKVQSGLISNRSHPDHTQLLSSCDQLMRMISTQFWWSVILLRESNQQRSQDA